MFHVCVTHISVGAQQTSRHQPARAALETCPVTENFARLKFLGSKPFQGRALPLSIMLDSGLENLKLENSEKKTLEENKSLLSGDFPNK